MTVKIFLPNYGKAFKLQVASSLFISFYSNPIRAINVQCLLIKVPDTVLCIFQLFTHEFLAGGKVKSGYGVHKFKPSRQKKLYIEKKSDNKTQTNVKLLLVTGFEFVYCVTAFYFSRKESNVPKLNGSLEITVLMCILSLKGNFVRNATHRMCNMSSSHKFFLVCTFGEWSQIIMKRLFNFGSSSMHIGVKFLLKEYR